MLRPPRAAVVLSLALLARAAAAAAQPTPPAPAAVDLARAAFQRGVLLAQQERWSAALDAFLESRRHADRPRTAFNVGLALQRVGRLREARVALRECIAMPGVVAEADLVADAHTLEAEVERSFVRMRLVVSPPHAEVRVNGAVVPDGHDEPLRELALDPGPQAVEVSAEGLATQRFEVTTRHGEVLQRRVDLAVVPGRVVVNVDRREATVSVDDEVVGHGTTRWQGSPGAHRVRVEFEGYQPFRLPVTVAAGAELRVEVTLVPQRTPWYRNPWLWGSVGLAVAGGVLAAVLIEHSAAPDGGSTQQVFQGATVRW